MPDEFQSDNRHRTRTNPPSSPEGSWHGTTREASCALTPSRISRSLPFPGPRTPFEPEWRPMQRVRPPRCPKSVRPSALQRCPTSSHRASSGRSPRGTDTSQASTGDSRAPTHRTPQLERARWADRPPVDQRSSRDLITNWLQARKALQSATAPARSRRASLVPVVGQPASLVQWRLGYCGWCTGRDRRADGAVFDQPCVAR